MGREPLPLISHATQDAVSRALRTINEREIDRAAEAEAKMASDPEMEGHVEAPRDEKEE